MSESNFQQFMQLEFEMQVHAFELEIEQWRKRARSKRERLALNYSQIMAICITLEDMQQRHRARLARLYSGDTTEQFLSNYRQVERALAHTHGVAAVFRHLLAQRHGPDQYVAALTATDIVSADCYQECVERAAALGALDPTRCRVPPLTYLSSDGSPAAYTRANTIELLGFRLSGEKEKLLPVPVISLPFHYVPTVWMYGALYHEVGHLMDNELGLRAQIARALGEPLSAAGHDGSRRAQWKEWAAELIADSFGIMLGGLGYALTLALLLQAEATEVLSVPVTAYPPRLVRIVLVTTILERLGPPAWVSAAHELRTSWLALYPEHAQLRPLLADLAWVVPMLLDTELGSRAHPYSLKAFALRVEANCDEVEEMLRLALYLETGFDRPRQRMAHFRNRLVLAASQIARSRVTDPAALAGIHERALEFILSSPQGYLAVDDRLSGEREAVLRQIAAAIDYESPQV